MALSNRIGEVTGRTSQGNGIRKLQLLTKREPVESRGAQAIEKEAQAQLISIVMFQEPAVDVVQKFQHEVLRERGQGAEIAIETGRGREKETETRIVTGVETKESPKDHTVVADMTTIETRLRNPDVDRVHALAVTLEVTAEIGAEIAAELEIMIDVGAEAEAAALRGRRTAAEETAAGREAVTEKTTEGTTEGMNAETQGDTEARVEIVTVTGIESGRGIVIGISLGKGEAQKRHIGAVRRKGCLLEKITDLNH
jgi:hypothetical protein